jgi:hypothetical protein
VNPSIVMLTRGNVDVWAWVCDVALERRQAEGWYIRDRRPKPPWAPVPYSLTCDNRIEYGCCTNDTFGVPLIEQPSEGATP